ncbi:hypothetical protein DQ400_14480 [Vreelandella sulfidaeris]|uniref:Sulfotransferase domain-containing protein n=1 Tax=Vreelandella sulfidaeris TaxID=115553 RepID=A0A365TL43_9GAMM|nr:sulfotransferase [Halomonas sulfidaeris]RBI66254.1 hypothetical protein DQ400_14480 [Halomonas sulfidaeris]
MKVDFMIIGAQKCGTTTLFDILNSHPSVNGCRPKEPHFFSSSKNWKNELQKYHNHFSKEEDMLHLEASTTYTFYPLRNLRIWKDIYDYNPNTKFIYLVRRPIDRIISSYMHRYEKGYTDLKIEEAIIKDRLYLDVTRYYTQISPYIRQFGRERVLIIDFDDFISHRQSVIDKISEFLSIDVSEFADYEEAKSNVSVGGQKKHYKFDSPSVPQRIIRKFFPPLWRMITDNSSRAFLKKPVLSIEFQEMILNMLELEVRELAILMDKDLSDWVVINK